MGDPCCTVTYSQWMGDPCCTLPCLRVPDECGWGPCVGRRNGWGKCEESGNTQSVDAPAGARRNWPQLVLWSPCSHQTGAFHSLSASTPQSWRRGSNNQRNVTHMHKFRYDLIFILYFICRDTCIGTRLNGEDRQTMMSNYVVNSPILRRVEHSTKYPDLP